MCAGVSPAGSCSQIRLAGAVEAGYLDVNGRRECSVAGDEAYGRVCVGNASDNQADQRLGFVRVIGLELKHGLARTGGGWDKADLQSRCGSRWHREDGDGRAIWQEPPGREVIEITGNQ